MKHITCPVCFEQIGVPEIGWRCERPGCHNAVFFREKEKIPFLERAGLVTSPRRWIHKTCGREATLRVCPNPKCHEELPSDLENLPNLRIAVIGAKGAGKSHFVAMLIHRLKEMANEFGTSLMPLTRKTSDRYENEFWEPLMNGCTIAITQPDEQANPPLLYSLQLPGKGNRQVMLTFFDTAGESFQNGEGMGAIKRYIYKASGLICLLDPLQLNGIRSSLLEAGHTEEELPPQKDDSGKIRDTGNIIECVWQVINEGRALRGKAIDIPLAVAFSKMDFVPDAGRTARAMCNKLRRGTRHRGVFHEGEFREIDELMRAWVGEVDDRRTILQGVKRFRRTGFFGFSALGSNPVGERLGKPLAPWRVEDPLLWILAQKGWIRTERG